MLRIGFDQGFDFFVIMSIVDKRQRIVNVLDLLLSKNRVEFFYAGAEIQGIREFQEMGNGRIRILHHTYKC
jgi:hypothetical protein